LPTAVLIVNYRTYRDLAQCLVSLVPHLGAGDEVVVVDYESDRAALIEALRIAEGSVRVVTVPRSDNRGFAAGVNLAAAQTRTSHFLLLNPDSVVQGPVVRVLESWLASHPDVGVAGPRVLNADGSVQPSARRFPDLTTLFGGRSTWLTRRFPRNWFSRRNLVSVDARAPMNVDWISGACLMTRRDIFEQLGGFDEGFFLYWEDADYCYRVAAAGFRRVYVPLASVRHSGGHAAARDPTVAIRAFHRSAFRMYWKHASALGRLVAPIVGAGLWMRGEQQVWRSRSRGAP
jgi:GT2 family glycosyltransferase